MTLAAAMPIPFVPRTKLRPPRLPDDLLQRQRLIEKLDRPQTLSLVIAPAGYGKTTLISTWLAQCGAPYAWLSLERDDDTLPCFLAGFAAALRTLVPPLHGELGKLLQPPTEEPNVQQVLQQALPILLNTLDMREERFVVVLDDYHHMHDPAIHQLIGGLLEHPPRALQLVLTARHDPPLPPRLRCCGNVTEIRARELCFTEQEAQAFLGQFVAEPLPARAVVGVVEKSEGWAVPLRLAAMLIYQRQDAAVLHKALQICERSLLDYLDAEVIGQLPEDVQTFLVRTSILNPLNAALCDAVLRAARGDGQEGRASMATLRMLADHGVFVEEIDEAGDWFRCHELFRHLLQRRLRSIHSEEEIDVLIQRARVWQEQNDERDQVRDQAVPAQSYVSVLRDMSAHNSPAATDSGTGVESAGPPAALHGPDAMSMAAQVAAEPRDRGRAKSQPTAGEQASALLTYREMDVLTLLCQRLTNKEIASQLGIATETVRQHTVHLYRKLGVEGRRQAIVQARILGMEVPPVDSLRVGPHTGGASRPAPAGAER